jgi:putative DNA primase/helicase
MDFSQPEYPRPTIDALERLFGNVETTAALPPQQVMWRLGQLRADDTQGQKDLAREIARGKFDPMELGQIVDAFKRTTGRPKADITATINHYRKEIAATAPDAGVVCADTTLRKHYAGGLHLIRNAKQFWAYNGRYWEREEDDYVKGRCVGVAREMPEEGDTAALAAKALSLLVGTAAEKGDPLGLMATRKPIINCRNGELHLEGGNVWLQDHSYQSRLTSCLEVDYDPQATCPIWERTILETMGASTNPTDMVRHIQEVFGYIIQPRRYIPLVLMMQGSGSNGKSATMKVLRALLGNDGYAASSLSDLEERFGISQTVGKLMYLDDDVDTGTRLPDGLLKKISEDKPITTEIKYGNHFTFMSTVVPVLLVNNFPLTADLSNGLRRRIMVIPFGGNFAQSDARNNPFDWCIENELAGILNWAIAGYERLDARGHFIEPKDCTAAKDKWLNDANPIAAFLSEHICRTHDGRGWLAVKAIYDKFIEWCSASGHRQTATLQSFRKGLESLGFAVAQKDVGNCAIGVTWK